MTQNKCRQQRSIKSIVAAKDRYKLAHLFVTWKEISDKNTKKRNLFKLEKLYVKQKFLNAWMDVYCKTKDEHKKQYAAQAFYKTILVSKLFKSMKLYAVHHKLVGMRLLTRTN